MSDLISQAQAAADCGNWARVTDLLQHILLSDDALLLEGGNGEVLLHLALQVLRAGDFHEQWEVAKVFSSFGVAAIAPLIALLQDEEADLEAQWFAARILGDSNHPTAIRALVEQLKASDDEDLSQMLAEALANLGTPAIAALAELLAAAETRLFALQALAQIRHPETIPPLLSVVHDPQPTIRAIAIEALSSFRDPRTPDVFIQALTDPAAAVRKAAIAALSVRTDLREALELVTQLANCLWDVDLSVCQQAALALGRLGSDAAIPPLVRILTSANTPIPLQQDTVRALSWLGTSNALETLKQWLFAEATPYPREVQSEVIAALGRWSQPELQLIAAEALVHTLTVPSVVNDTALRQAIATALGTLKQPSTLEPLIQLLADDDAGVRLHVIAALKSIDPKTAYARLEEMQTNQELSDNLRAGIAVALSEWQTELPR
ncbi:MAG: HEAT repeat domain-containing protein [Oscillatoriales cyanobacterium C42_A2020_001]|nr:HEAT repeat domain-containing protein [Leptolyngbyaceae cyanobacterium C42_A2020_001]